MLRKIMIVLVAMAAMGAMAIPTDVSARGGARSGGHYSGGHYSGGYRGGYYGGYRGGYRGGYGYGLGYYAYPYTYYDNSSYYDPYYYDAPPTAQYEPDPAYVAPVPSPNGSGRQCWVSTDPDRGFGYYRPC